MAPKRKRANVPPRSDRDRLIADLFTEASRLAAVSGAQVAVVTVLPDGEVRQYGCPSVSSVVGRYLGSLSTGGAPMATDQERTDRIVRRYVERKRAADGSYGGGTAKERELKDLRWELEVLGKLRERLGGGA